MNNDKIYVAISSSEIELCRRSGHLLQYIICPWFIFLSIFGCKINEIFESST